MIDLFLEPVIEETLAVNGYRTWRRTGEWRLRFVEQNPDGTIGETITEQDLGEVASLHIERAASDFAVWVNGARVIE